MLTLRLRGNPCGPWKCRLIKSKDNANKIKKAKETEAKIKIVL